MDAATLALKLIDRDVSLETHKTDGDTLAPGDIVAVMQGEARSILIAERTMLNFLGRLSGIATLTSSFAERMAHTKAKIVCTRKTTPGHRAVEKRAVRCGGGTSHRYGLDDAILIKDNHIAACGSIADALQRAHAYAGHLRMIEIEVVFEIVVVRQLITQLIKRQYTIFWVHHDGRAEFALDVYQYGRAKAVNVGVSVVGGTFVNSLGKSSRLLRR